MEAKLIVDLQGPELRVGTLKEPVSLAEGAEVLLGAGGIPVPAAALAAARTGDEISLDDSALLLTVVEERPDALLCQVERGGLLKSRKSMAILGVQPDTPALTEEDRRNLDWAARCGVTDVLQPFVRGAEDLAVLRGALAERGLERVRVMAKIENQLGIEKLDEIIDASDVICIARGWSGWTRYYPPPTSCASPGAIWGTVCRCGSCPPRRRASPPGAGRRGGPSLW